MTIIDPTSNSTLAANTTIKVSIGFNPTSQVPQIVNASLICPDSGLSPFSVNISNGLGSFPVPKNFYGNNNFTVSDPGGKYRTTTNRPIYVTQNIIIEQPVNLQVIEYPNNITTLVRTGLQMFPVTFNMSLICSTFAKGFIT